MVNNSRNMKRLILFNLLLGMVVLCSTSVEAQTQDQNRKISRKEQREIAQQQANQQFEIARQALKDSMFVVEVDRIIGQLGRTVYVSANENFVLMNRDYASVQLAVLPAHAGMNGAGGITLAGNASDVQERIDKHGNVTCQFRVQGNSISSTVIVTLYKGDNQVSAVMNSTFNNGRITFYGRLLPAHASKVFKAQPNIVVP